MADMDYGPISSGLEGLFLTGRLLDWAQTRKIARDPMRYREKTSFLQDHPEQKEVDALMAAGMLGHYYGSKELPEKIRIPLQLVTLIDQWRNVKNNKKIGLGVDKEALLAGLALTTKLVMDSKKDQSVEAGMINDKTPGILYTRKF